MTEPEATDRRTGAADREDGSRVRWPAGGVTRRRRPRETAWRWLPAGVVLVAVVLLIAVPLLALARTALEDGLAALLEAVSSAAPAIWASVWTSLGATILAVGMGTSVAILTERTTVPGRRGLRMAMLVAFIVPGYVAAMGWLDAYGPGGLLDDLVGFAAPALVGPLGIVIVLGVEAAPVAFFVVAAGLATRAEPDMERAARASGADAMTAFRTVTLPLLGPVLAGAAIIAFVLSVTSFGVPAVLGIPAGFSTMTTRIYRDLAFSADPASFVRALGLAVVLALGVAVVIAIGDALLGRRRRERSGVFSGPLGYGGGAVRGSAARGSAGGIIAWVIVVLVVVVPLVALALTALARAPGLAPGPASWTLENFQEVIGPHSLKALVNSTVLAAVAAAGVVVLAVAVVSARRGRGVGTIGGLVSLTFALPGSTLAVAVLLAYGMALRDTLLIILVAYLAKFWALGHRPVAAGLDGMAADLQRAARASGADGWTTTRTIVLPI
ncbi:MAG TPA: ABC transporter permease subunit, partial [Candidatus Limnocylindrales bacterium]|nr:ABC transporter permease subunit [Candidatus Limnocylindrales bacterium]